MAWVHRNASQPCLFRYNQVLETECSIAASLLIDVIGYLERTGIPVANVITALQLDSSVLDQGLHTAENHNPGALNILGYVLLSCRSVDEALGRLAQYAALLNDGLLVQVTKNGDRTRVQYKAIQVPGNYLVTSPRQAMEAMACGIVVTLRRLTTNANHPLAVSFQHSAPSILTEHLRIFGPAVSFDQPENFIEFHSAYLNTDLLSSNPQLLEMFEAQARRLFDQLDKRGPVSRRVLAQLARRIAGVTPSLKEVANELAMSERTVQRELRMDNTSFRQLVEDTRKEIAIQHLAQPGASATETAFLLGFSEPSAFTRAFRRWTGSVPTQFQTS